MRRDNLEVVVDLFRFFKCLPRLVTLAACIFVTQRIGLPPKASAGSIPVTNTLPLGLPLRNQFDADRNAIQLGTYLFQSKALSKDKTVACSSCHDAQRAYSGNQPRALGVTHLLTRRHAPPLFNLYIFQYLMSDGRVSNLEQQILLPLESSEMDVDWQIACAELNKTPAAMQLAADNKMSFFDRPAVVSAIVSFVSSLVSGGSRFDAFFYGGNKKALSATEQNGLRIFLRKGRCATCHLLSGLSAPFTDGGFHSLGIGFDGHAYKDDGRYSITGDSHDKGAFKTPTLRNVALRPYLMHDGSMTSIEQVIEFYNHGGNANAPNIDPRIKPLYLSDQEIQELAAFLRALSSEVVLQVRP